MYDLGQIKWEILEESRREDSLATALVRDAQFLTLVPIDSVPPGALRVPWQAGYALIPEWHR